MQQIFKYKLLIITLFIVVISAVGISFLKAGSSVNDHEIALVIHGGAGNINPENVNDSMKLVYEQKLQEALDIGYKILKEGGSSLDAVEETVRFLEDCPLFNAGRGAVFTAEGTNELDASIMDGASGNAGAVAGVTTLRNPISAARLVMQESPHVMMAGDGAELFAISKGATEVSPEYFKTEARWNAWLRKKEELDKKGTVGAVAIDKKGNIAAATSTGGMSWKKYGRIGDSPVIGAGTYASNATCGVSCTGHGEYFIRNVVAYDVAARMKYSGASLQKAVDDIIHGVLKDQKANGGLIAIDRDANIVMEFNTAGMFRGYVKENQEPQVFLFGDEK